jgi:alkylation response protein AidB-like acyl-CoA dehydrogenase
VEGSDRCRALRPARPRGLTQLAVDIVGVGALTIGESWSYELLRARGNTIEGGTTEVLKNIVAERVLGLPRLKAAA